MLHQMAQYLTETIFDFGYIGIFLLMLIESSFIPFPSEIVLIPAGYLAQQNSMSIPIILISSLLGSISGGLINYFLALFVGRKFLLRYGKYLFISNSSLLRMETFFNKHGAIATFTGRLIPGIRQLISIPAGLAKMDLKKFILYTSFGAFIWSVVLVALGYVIGENQELITQYLSNIIYITLIVLIIIVLIYTKKYKNATTN